MTPVEIDNKLGFYGMTEIKFKCLQLTKRIIELSGCNDMQSIRYLQDLLHLLTAIYKGQKL